MVDTQLILVSPKYCMSTISFVSYAMPDLIAETKWIFSGDKINCRDATEHFLHFLSVQTFVLKIHEFTKVSTPANAKERLKKRVTNTKTYCFQ